MFGPAVAGLVELVEVGARWHSQHVVVGRVAMAAGSDTALPWQDMHCASAVTCVGRAGAAAVVEVWHTRHSFVGIPP